MGSLESGVWLVDTLLNELVVALLLMEAHLPNTFPVDLITCLFYR